MARVLVVRTDNIGDCVLFSGALRWIREARQGDVIHLLVQPHVRNLFEKLSVSNRSQAVALYLKS